MTERISNATYGGYDNKVLYEACTALLSVVATLPISDKFEARRNAANLPQQTALSLAQADPHTPLSDALFALASAMDLYMHFGTRPHLEASDVGVALNQTMQQGLP